MTSNGTSWVFPPALNATFVQDFHAQNTAGGVLPLLLAAIQNLTLQERFDSGLQAEGWGGDDAVISRGDTIEGDFKDRGLRIYGLNCVLCTSGRGEGSIENACSNCWYTRSAAHSFFRTNVQQTPTRTT